MKCSSLAANVPREKSYISNPPLLMELDLFHRIESFNLRLRFPLPLLSLEFNSSETGGRKNFHPYAAAGYSSCLMES